MSSKAETDTPVPQGTLSGFWRSLASASGGARQPPRTAALSGSQIKAPGSAGGYLLLPFDWEVNQQWSSCCVSLE
jgi:hypothetical protein